MLKKTLIIFFIVSTFGLQAQLVIKDYFGTFNNEFEFYKYHYRVHFEFKDSIVQGVSLTKGRNYEAIAKVRGVWRKATKEIVFEEYKIDTIIAEANFKEDFCFKKLNFKDFNWDNKVLDVFVSYKTDNEELECNQGTVYLKKDDGFGERYYFDEFELKFLYGEMTRKKKEKKEKKDRNKSPKEEDGFDFSKLDEIDVSDQVDDDEKDKNLDNKKSVTKKEEDDFDFSKLDDIDISDQMEKEEDLEIKELPKNQILKKNEVRKVYLKEGSKKIVIKFWDSGYVDGDILSININGERIIKEVKAKKSPYTVPVPISENLDEIKIEIISEDTGLVGNNTTNLKIITEEDSIPLSLDLKQDERTIIILNNGHKTSVEKIK